jgi:hypothetical protein
MNLDAIKLGAERLLQQSETEQAFYALAGKLDVLDRHRYVRLCQVAVERWLAPEDVLELHRSVLPNQEARYQGTRVEAVRFRWKTWTPVTVDRIGDDCVRLFVPDYGSLPIPRGDFVGHVLKGLVRPRA